MFSGTGKACLSQQIPSTYSLPVAGIMGSLSGVRQQIQMDRQLAGIQFNWKSGVGAWQINVQLITSTSNVFLSDPPKVAISELRSGTTVGDRVTFHCDIDRGYPRNHEITWYRDGQLIPGQNGELYTFNIASADNFKEYSCRADNGYKVEDSLVLSFDGTHLLHT